MSENVFVESYHKELLRTGYPFDRYAPITLSSGVMLPTGSMIDASIYTDSTKSIPRLTAISKDNTRITFHVGDFYGTFVFDGMDDIVELYTDTGLFGGILLINCERIRPLKSWANGDFTVTSDSRFCLRCIEMLPQVGITRFAADDGKFVSGNVIIAAGTGGLFRLLQDSDVVHIEVNFIGDPVYSITFNESIPQLPLRSITFGIDGNIDGSVDGGADSNDVSAKIRPDDNGSIAMLPRNLQLSNLEHDPLQINTVDDTVTLSLAGVK